MSDWYTLADDGKTPIKCSPGEFIFDDDRRFTARVETGVGDVSTVFLGLDHRHEGDADKRPVLWETLVFGGPLADEQIRYRTHEDATAGHAAMVERVKAAPGVQQHNRGQRFYEAFMDSPSWRQLSKPEKSLYMAAAERFLKAESEAEL